RKGDKKDKKGKKAEPDKKAKIVDEDGEAADEEEEAAAVGAIDKAKRLGSKNIHWYEWSREGSFSKTDRTVAKGKSLHEAGRVTGSPEYAWVRTEDEQVGYVRVKNLTVETWGADKTPSPVGANNLLETTDGK